MVKKERMRLLKPIAEAAGLKQNGDFAYKVIEKDGLYAICGFVIDSSWNKYEGRCEFFFELLFVPFASEMAYKSVGVCEMTMHVGYLTAEQIIEKQDEIVRRFKEFYREHSSMELVYSRKVYVEGYLLGTTLANAYFSALMGDYETARKYAEYIIRKTKELVIAVPTVDYGHLYIGYGEELIRMIDSRNYAELRAEMMRHQQLRLKALKMPEDWNEGLAREELRTDPDDGGGWWKRFLS